MLLNFIKKISGLGLFFSFFTTIFFAEAIMHFSRCYGFDCMLIFPLIICPIGILAFIFIPLSYRFGSRLQKKSLNVRKQNIILLIIGIILIEVITALPLAITYQYRSLSFIGKREKFDQETVRILETHVSDPVNFFFWKNGYLPYDLNEIIDYAVKARFESVRKLSKNRYLEIINDKKRKITYEKNGDIEYLICANFKKPFNKFFNKYLLKLDFELGYEHQYYHGVGKECFKKTVDIPDDIYFGIIDDVAMNERLGHIKECIKGGENINNCYRRCCKSKSDMYIKENEICAKFFTNNIVMTEQAIAHLKKVFNKPEYNKYSNFYNKYFIFRHKSGEQCFVF
ncbi:hypothetical protein KKD57_06950 [Patescibacteria group bacterium]|nr:hypothetical protein [Patescibacteria group bacterium]MBU4339253.1 hypothetical protein [Patescibacteria group bacterium]